MPFVPGSVPGWTDGLGNPIEWESPPKFDGDGGWCVVVSHATDGDGWVYGTNFIRCGCVLMTGFCAPMRGCLWGVCLHADSSCGQRSEAMYACSHPSSCCINRVVAHACA